MLSPLGLILLLLLPLGLLCPPGRARALRALRWADRGVNAGGEWGRGSWCRSDGARWVAVMLVSSLVATIVIWRIYRYGTENQASRDELLSCQAGLAKLNAEHVALAEKNCRRGVALRAGVTSIARFLSIEGFLV